MTPPLGILITICIVMLLVVLEGLVIRYGRQYGEVAFPVVLLVNAILIVTSSATLTAIWMAVLTRSR